MRFEEFEDKIEKEVVLVTVEGETFQGKLFLGESEFDSSSGEDEVDLDIHGGVYLGIPFSDIKSLQLV